MDKEVLTALAALEHQIYASEISQWEALYVPFSISYRVGLTPERLEQAYHFKLTVRYVYAVNPELAEFLRCMRASTFTPSPHEGDVRLGIRFYSKNNAVSFSVYVTKTLLGVIIGGKPYKVEGSIKKWFTAFAKRRFE